MTSDLNQGRLKFLRLFFNTLLKWHVDCGMKFIDDLCKVKYMSRFILVLAALFLVLIGGCGKSQKHFKLDPAFKQYFLFKNGSKWLYSSVSDTSDKETITSHD